MTTIKRWLIAVVAVGALAGLICGCGVFSLRSSRPAPGSPGRTHVEALLARVAVIARRPHPGGYQRDCGAGSGCVFGPAWSDDTTAPDAHNGCDTRNDVLASSLTRVRFRIGTHDCVVVAGVLADPYSGQRIVFTKQHANEVQIDHVYPLAAAWDMGAAHWPMAKRMRFANDVAYNLLAVNGKDNQDKSDSLPAQWMPPSPAYRCFYAGKFLTVAIRYGLPITRADKAALTRAADRCR